MAAVMSAFEQFDVICDINSQASRWENYIDHYKDYCLAFDVADAKCKIALLLHSAGVDVRRYRRYIQYWYFIPQVKMKTSILKLEML